MRPLQILLIIALWAVSSGHHQIQSKKKEDTSSSSESTVKTKIRLSKEVESHQV